MSSILFVLAAIMVAVSAPPALPYSPLARSFFSVRKFWPTQRVTVCGSFVK